MVGAPQRKFKFAQKLHMQCRAAGKTWKFHRHLTYCVTRSTARGGLQQPMSKPKVAVVVPADTSGESYRQMEEAGCEMTLADVTWAKGFNATADEFLRLCDGADGQRVLAAHAEVHLAAFVIQHVEVTRRWGNLFLIENISSGCDGLGFERFGMKGTGKFSAQDAPSG